MGSRRDFEETERKKLAKPGSAICAEPADLNNQERLAQAAGLCALRNELLRDVGEDIGEVLHQIYAHPLVGNTDNVIGVC